MRGVADEFGVTIEVRPANVDSMRWQELGHPRKPMKIKQKTINELDTHLGASPDDIGRISSTQWTMIDQNQLEPVLVDWARAGLPVV